jgi:protein TonB
VRVSLRAPKPPPPKPQPEEKPEVKPEPEPKPKPKPAKKKRILRAKKVKKLTPEPEPPAEAPPVQEPPKPIPRKFAVTLGATISTGGIAVPTQEGGANLLADASAAGARNSDEEPAESGEVVPAKVTEVTSMPRVLRKPTNEELQKSYPEEARRMGLEGDVRLELLISEKGRVIRTRVLRSAGHGFDEAARKLVKLFRFRPAAQGDKPVAVWIPWTYKFRLDL